MDASQRGIKMKMAKEIYQIYMETDGQLKRVGSVGWRQDPVDALDGWLNQSPDILEYVKVPQGKKVVFVLMDVDVEPVWNIVLHRLVATPAHAYTVERA
jgi:hypothetical protein